MNPILSSHKLNQIACGTRAVVKSISFSNKKLAHKLLTMGIVAGTLIEVMRAAPMGDPIRIKALGSELSLRLSEAESVEVLPL